MMEYGDFPMCKRGQKKWLLQVYRTVGVLKDKFVQNIYLIFGLFNIKHKRIMFPSLFACCKRKNLTTTW